LTVRLQELGWLQFERLCEELLELPADAWTGRADEGRAAKTADGREVWAAWERGHPVLEVGGTSVDVAAEVLARPLLRRRVPSVLGVCDLDALIPPGALARSTGDVAAARELARVFVPTRAYGRTLAVLERHRFAVVTGPPEMGKTAIARTLGLALLTEGRELHECVRPEQLWQAFDRDRPQLFVADDAFGSTEYRPEAAERWALELDRVLRAMDERHWLVWTSRPSPLKAGLRRIHREHGVERFPQPAQVQVAATDLDVEEKAVILFRHARGAGLSPPAIELVRRYGWFVVEHPHFTPERIRRFVDDRLPTLARVGPSVAPERLAAAVAEEIQEPTAAMRASLRALPDEHRALLVALLDAPAGAVSERDLAATARRHASVAFPKPPGELLDRLTDHFLRLVPPASLTWIHPSWRDLVIEELAGDGWARRRFVERCSLDGLLLALSIGGGAAGERALPLLRDDADWDTVGDRLHTLVPELADDELLRLLAGLREAFRGAGDRPDELRALGRTALHAALPRLRGGVPSISLLDAWLALAAFYGRSAGEPDVALAWIEFLPTSRVDPSDAEALRELEEWLRLVTTLRAHDPEALRRFGFPERQAEVLGQFLEDAQRLAPDAPTAGLAAACAERLASCVPLYELQARGIAALLRLRRDEEPLPDPRPAFVPTDQVTLVARILADLAG
jgi:hypothetical protein